jgi:6-phosphofructokinase 1
MPKVIGVLTAGGDCPGLNAVIRGVVTRATEVHDAEVLGIRNGWEGLMEGRTMALDRDAVRGILTRGGTILGTSRMDPYVHGDGLASCQRTIQRNGIDTLVVIGGDGTLASALRLSEEGLPVIGVPKTIDNDINGTDITFGFDTAVQIATDAIDRLASTAEAHNRVIVVEVMGRTKGWIATYAGIAGGADAIIIPERPYDLNEVAGIVRARHRRGKSYSIVVVAEGVEAPEGTQLETKTDAFGFARLGGVGYSIAADLEGLTGFETRVSVLGHIQRGGTPTAFDRVLATRLGVAAADLAVEGQSGVMVAVRGMNIESVSIEEACATVRGVPPELYDTAATFFG